MGNLRCHWVRDRLPLYAGDDLRGLDRRRVERHLIGCPQCRQHQTALGQALETLRTVAAVPPAAPDTSSLWPALARQIREARRPAPVSPWPSFLTVAGSWLRANPWPAVGLGLGLLVSLEVGLDLRHQAATAQAHLRAKASPLVAARPKPGPQPDTTSAPRSNLGHELPAPVVESSPPASRLDETPIYDLDHGRPMPPDARDVRDTKATY